MNRPLATTLLGLASMLVVAHADAQIAGSTTVGVETTTVQIVTAGWSVKKQVIGKTVYNADGESVGKIDDLIIAPGSAISTVIVGAGGFVGLKRHQVAIPVAQLQESDGNFVLPGATKAAIKALPAFEYAKAAPARALPDAGRGAPSGARSTDQ